MPVNILASTRGDNFIYVLHVGGEAMLVDPIDAPLAIAAVRDAGLALRGVLNTHWHPDHVGGNAAVREAFPDAPLIAPRDELDLVAQTGGVEPDQGVGQGDALTLGGETIRVLATPGHTAGHVSYLMGGDLISGDTIFSAGAGNCRFGGDPGVLFETFARVLRDLDPALVFYPGHDYTTRNLEFASSVLPEDDAVAAALDASRQVAPRTLVRKSLGDERAYNLFMRFDEEPLQRALQRERGDVWQEQRALAEGDDEATFRALRALRDQW